MIPIYSGYSNALDYCSEEYVAPIMWNVMNKRALKSELDNVGDDLYDNYFDSYEYSNEDSSLRGDIPSYIGSYDSSDSSSSEVTTPRKGKQLLYILQVYSFRLEH